MKTTVLERRHIALLRRDSSMWKFEVFKNTCFEEHLRMTASGLLASYYQAHGLIAGSINDKYFCVSL